MGLGSRIRHYGSLILALFIALGQILLVFAANPLLLIGFSDYLPSRPTPSTDISSVSGFYGPGAYWAWFICTISAVVGSTTKSHPPSPVLSLDQVASFIYSTYSTYWYYIRVLYYGLYGSNILRDPSVQAASLVLNMSALLHALGVMVSVEEKRIPWVLFAAWDILLLFFSPTMSVHLFSALLHLTIPLMFYILAIVSEKFQIYWTTRSFPFLIFILLEGVKAHYFGTYSFTFTPKTASKITDMDQMVSFMTAIAGVVYQWQLWSVPSLVQRLRIRSQQNSLCINAMRLESGETQRG
jgi:hypothetical protein